MHEVFGHAMGCLASAQSDNVHLISGGITFEGADLTCSFFLIVVIFNLFFYLFILKDEWCLVHIQPVVFAL